MVMGDAQSMPFADDEFDYVIASHIAEHVDDPRRFCAELSRVAARGYVETPGWLGDMLLREPFHVWRVRTSNRGLRFDRVVDSRPLGSLADAFYALVYMGVPRPGHRTWVPRGRAGARAAWAVRVVAARALLLPGVRGLFYTVCEWDGSVTADVRGAASDRS
jgi:SAM-dependent methyltransferase